MCVAVPETDIGSFSAKTNANDPVLGPAHLSQLSSVHTSRVKQYSTLSVRSIPKKIKSYFWRGVDRNVYNAHMKANENIKIEGKARRSEFKCQTLHILTVHTMEKHIVERQCSCTAV